MAVNNSLVTQEQAEKQLPFSQVINSVPYQKMISSTLKDRNTANRFVASIVSAVATTPALQNCTPKTIISAALLGEGLKLSPSPQLGQFYLVPFNQKEKKDKNGRVIQEACTNATFVLGYKGYIQLATRSGEYKHINAMPIKEGELILDRDVIARREELEAERNNSTESDGNVENTVVENTIEPEVTTEINDETAKMYADSIYEKITKYKNDNQITNQEISSSNLPIYLIPADATGIIYPTLESWYYIEEGKVYAYIVIEEEQYHFCYQGEINKVKEGEC